MKEFNLINGDSLIELKNLEENSIDSCVTDPPYELGFMGKKWDNTGIAYNVELWKEVYRVLKPGGHLLSFGGTRTYHRMAVAIEDAGFEIRDQIQWIYGSGFPKSLNIGKAIDKSKGVRGHDGSGFNSAGGALPSNGGSKFRSDHPEYVKPSGITEEAKQWDGYGTALKPANEPIVLARKPLSEKTVAANVLRWGTGCINIDGCRVGKTNDVSGWSKSGSNAGENQCMSGANYERAPKPDNSQGRFPANVIHDGIETEWAKYFYCAKASKRDRNEGLEDFKSEALKGFNASPREGHGEVRDVSYHKNNHPTVKPTTLMQYLVRLVTPKGGTVLDPFMGSGSTGKACVKEEMDFVGIEKEEEYFNISKARIEIYENK